MLGKAHLQGPGKQACQTAAGPGEQNPAAPPRARHHTQAREVYPRTGARPPVWHRWAGPAESGGWGWNSEKNLGTLCPTQEQGDHQQHLKCVVLEVSLAMDKPKPTWLHTRLSQPPMLTAHRRRGLPISGHDIYFRSLVFLTHDVHHSVNIYRKQNAKENNLPSKHKATSRTRPKDDHDVATTRWGP